eukprot:6386612-Alexandrium_andersonii.AAC.1
MWNPVPVHLHVQPRAHVVVESTVARGLGDKPEEGVHVGRQGPDGHADELAREVVNPGRRG